MAASLTARSNEVLVWNDVMLRAVRLDNSGPTLSARNLAILHLGIYDAVNSITRTHQEYAFRLDAPPECSPEAAVAAAGLHVVTALYPGIAALADATFASWRGTAGGGASVSNGLALGTEIASRMVQRRADDGASTDTPYVPSADPGQWRRTPPFFRPPFAPGWRYVRPFAIPEVDAFVVPPPPDLSSAEYARDLAEVRALGAIDSSLRTPEETRIAVFWSDFSYTAMPPGHWHEITAGIAIQRATDLAGTARLMALLSLAQADAAIVCWEGKYRYNFWRPVTAIQRAGEDGNPDTLPDPGWNHLLAAPPFPSYPSGHSTFSQASAEAIRQFYGTDAISFSAHSDALPGVIRAFNSLTACAAEVGMSRVYGGIHFQFDNRAGKRSGAKIAADQAANWLLPEAALPLVVFDRLNGALAGIRVHGRIGTRVILQESSDLRVWTSWTTNVALPGGVRVLSTLSGGQHFFRAIELPPN